MDRHSALTAAPRRGPKPAGTDASAPSRNMRRRGQGHSTRPVPWLFALPALALCAGVLLVPSVLGAGYAFTDWDGLTAPNWVGTANFSEFLGAPDGAGILVRTVIIVVCYSLGVNAVGLGLALGLSRMLRTRNFLRALFFVPAIVSPLVVGYVWRFVLDTYGPLNEALDFLGADGLSRPWLGESETALAAIVIVMIWQFSGYHMLIYLAGIEGIQPELHEAASVDGAGSWRRFRDITLPLSAPALVIGFTLSMITAFMLFDQVMALTGGGPAGATDTLGTHVYKQAFVNGRYGASAAVALLLVLAVCTIAVVRTWAVRRRAR